MSGRLNSRSSANSNSSSSSNNNYFLCCYPATTGQHRNNADSPTDSADSASLDYNSTSLNLGSSLLALVSLAIIATAVSTGQWLLTEERLPKLLQRTSGTAAGNGSSSASQQGLAGSSSSSSSSEQEVKFTYSGLWRVCVAKGTSMEYECSSIDYFPKEEYSPDPSDSTMAIPYAVTKSAIFFFTATALLVVAEVCYFAGQVVRPKPSIYVFAAGITFIISGLLMLVGMVMYISVFKAEVGSKLRPRSSFQGPPFVYRYGYSFLLYVSGFISTEFAGTTAVFLHISWQQLELAREFSKRKCPNRDAAYHHLDANHHLNHHHHNHFNHLHNHHVVLPSSCQPSPHVSQAGHHQVAAAAAAAAAASTYGGYLCERHQKRYFYETEPAIGCHLHHHPHHHSLDYEQLEYMAGQSQDCGHYHHGMTHDLTTETVSTIADALQEEYGLQHEFVTFDLGENLPPLPETVRNSAWKSNSFKKTTPV